MSRASSRARARRCLPRRRYINSLRNRAVHDEKTITPADAAGAVKELFHVCFWLARTYARRSASRRTGLRSTPARSSRRDDALKKAFVHIKAAAGRARRQERRADGAARRQGEPRRRAEAAARRGRRRAQGQPRRAPDTHDYSEAETRDRFIDLLLQRGRLAARPAATTASSESRACRTTQGKGFVDYVLWGDDGKPLGAGRGQAHPQGRAQSASSRRSSTPTAWRSSSASGR